MRLIAIIATALLLLTGCPPKDRGPDPAASEQAAERPEEWSGVTFDEEVASLDANFELASDGGVACDDLFRLEPVAMLGRLAEEQIICLEHRLRHADRQTRRDSISRVLMADAWAKQDFHRWEGAARRHLEEIDQSDPDLAYLLALRLSHRGYQDAYEALRYAELALENKRDWGPEVHARRVNALLKIRALSAQKLWHHYEDRLLADQGKTAEITEHVDTWRARSKAMAREWLEWAKSAGQDTREPFDVCVSASGTVEYCDLGFETEEEGPAEADAGEADPGTG